MSSITRRQLLLGGGALVACGLGTAASLSGSGWWKRPPEVAEGQGPIQPPTAWSVEARYYASFSGQGALDCSSCHGAAGESLSVSYCHVPHTGSYVQCNLCPHQCIIPDGERGECRVRENRDGRLYSLVYGNPCAVHIDPIEKKPLYHFMPTAQALSLATAGCNLRCKYCQNWTISQVGPEKTRNADLPPEDVVQLAQEQEVPVIAYTYSEPIVFYEYVFETARLAREAGLRNTVVSAGFINREPLLALCEVVDAIKIDLKGYDRGFYREVCGGELEPVLETIDTIHETGTHLEIVNLVVPTLNDSLEQLRALAGWILNEVSPEVPLHFSRFYPQYKLDNLPPTPVETLEDARRIAMEEGMQFVYIGNVGGHPGNHTYCPACGEVLVERVGFSVKSYHIEDGVCGFCGAPIPGVWWPEASDTVIEPAMPFRDGDLRIEHGERDADQGT